MAFMQVEGRPLDNIVTAINSLKTNQDDLTALQTTVAGKINTADAVKKTDIRVYSVTMSGTSQTINDSSITEHTACFFIGLNIMNLVTPLNWTTTAGKLTITTTTAPISSITFTVVLIETTTA